MTGYSLPIDVLEVSIRPFHFFYSIGEEGSEAYAILRWPKLPVELF